MRLQQHKGVIGFIRMYDLLRMMHKSRFMFTDGGTAPLQFLSQPVIHMVWKVDRRISSAALSRLCNEQNTMKRRIPSVKVTDKGEISLH